MTTWLDDYAFRLCKGLSTSERALRARDVRTFMGAYTKKNIAIAADPSLNPAYRVGVRFDADLHPFFNESFASVRSAVRVSPALVGSLETSVSSRSQVKALADHLSAFDYSYIDLSGNAFPLSANSEVKAVFVKGARVVDPVEPKAVDLENEIAVEAIIGLTGIFTRQRLVWSMGGSHVTHFVDSPDERLFPYTPDPIGLVAASNSDLGSLVVTIDSLISKVLAFVQMNRGTARASPIPMIGDSDPAFSMSRPGETRTLVQTLDLRLPIKDAVR